MRRLFIGGNWKMNTQMQSAIALAGGLAKAVPQPLPSVQVAVCPPFPYLPAVRQTVAGSGVELGAQNVWHEKPGAFTGEVAVEMLLDGGCKWVILGHSERRQLLAETDDLISRKSRAASSRGLGVILCVGETLQQRQAGQTEQVLDSQIDGSLAGIDAGAFARFVIA